MVRACGVWLSNHNHLLSGPVSEGGRCARAMWVLEERRLCVRATGHVVVLGEGCHAPCGCCTGKLCLQNMVQRATGCSKTEARKTREANKKAITMIFLAQRPKRAAQRVPEALRLHVRSSSACYLIAG